MRLLALVLCLLPSLGYSAYATGLTNWYRLENDETDTVGSANGFCVSCPSYVTASPSPKEGSYASGRLTEAGYISLPASVISDKTTKGRIEFWYNGNSMTAYGSLMTIYNAAGTRYFIPRITATSLHIQYTNNAGANVSADLTGLTHAQQTWYHISAQWDTNYVAIYRTTEGGTTVSVTHTVGVDFGTIAFVKMAWHYTGAEASSNDGYFDDIQIWNTTSSGPFPSVPTVASTIQDRSPILRNKLRLILSGIFTSPLHAMGENQLFEQRRNVDLFRNVETRERVRRMTPTMTRTPGRAPLLTPTPTATR